jgi:phage major head subunit gpT-like protein
MAKVKSLSELREFSTAVVATIDKGRTLAPVKYKEIARDISRLGTAPLLEIPNVGEIPLLDRIVNGVAPESRLEMGTTIIGSDEYGRKLRVKRIDVRDNRIGLYADGLTKMGKAMEATVDGICMSGIAAGITVTGKDGVTFFNASHPVGDTVQSNRASGGAAEFWCLADLRDPSSRLIDYGWIEEPIIIPPDQHKESSHHVWVVEAYFRARFTYGDWRAAYGSLNALTDVNVKAAREQMLIRTDENGAELGYEPTHLIVGPANLSAAEKLLGQEFLANGETNMTQEKKTGLKILYSPWLANPNFAANRMSKIIKAVA